MRIAIFGGTFDPIHSAHVRVAREAADAFHLDGVLFVPAAHPPHKADTATTFEHRFRMVEICCREDKRFAASRLEEGAGKSYSLLTIQRVKQTLAPGDELFFLIGADAFSEIGSWYKSAEVIAGVEFIVVARPGHHYQSPAGAKMQKLETLALPVASSEIRKKLESRADLGELPPGVREYVLTHHLYGI